MIFGLIDRQLRGRRGHRACSVRHLATVLVAVVLGSRGEGICGRGPVVAHVVPGALARFLVLPLIGGRPIGHGL